MTNKKVGGLNTCFVEVSLQERHRVSYAESCCVAKKIASLAKERSCKRGERGGTEGKQRCVVPCFVVLLFY